MTPKELIGNIISSYDDYLQSLEEGVEPIDVEAFVNSICAQLNQCIDDEVEHFIDNT